MAFPTLPVVHSRSREKQRAHELVMETLEAKPMESVSDMDLPSSSSDVPMAANGPLLMVKTKAALKQYPPYILCGKVR